MISRTLAPVDRQTDISIEEVGEALMLTYLAYYNNIPFAPRTNDSYMRAFGLERLNRIPRDLPTPGFVSAFATLPHRKTVTVAIEGTTDIVSQVVPLINNELFGPVGGLTLGRVWNFFRNQADLIVAKIQADTQLAAALADRGYMWTFTGHSLGAALADIVAYRFRQLQPAMSIRLIKFGCPRVGNTFYVNRTSSLVNTKSVYCGDDPIHQFPSALITTTFITNLTASALRLNACTPDVATKLPRTGGNLYGFAQEQTQSSGHFLNARASTLAFTPDNIWYDHVIKSYRLGMMNLAGRQNDLLKYRINYLEHNDENTWQNRWSPGTLTWGFMDGLSVVAPDPVEPISPQVAVAVQSPVAATGADEDDSWEETWEAPNVNRQVVPVLPPPIATSFNNRRVVRPRP